MPQGTRVVSGDNHGMICVWEKDSGNPVQTLPLAHSKAVLSVSISADGSTIASVGADDKVRQGRAGNSGPGDPHRPRRHLQRPARVLVQSRDALLLASSSNTAIGPTADCSRVLTGCHVCWYCRSQVSIWNVDIGIELVTLTAAIESHPLYCCFSPDGNKLAVSESNGNVMVWNVAAGCQWFVIYAAHKGKVTSCSWSADCRKFTTCGTDSVTAIWDAESGAPLFKFNLKAGPLTSCSVSPSGIYVAAGSTTGTLSVSNIAIAARNTPEPSFLFHWLATHESKASTFLYLRLLALYPYLANVQDAQGWSIVLHALSRGNAEVSNMILDALNNDCGILGLISAVPFSVQTRIKFHQNFQQDEGGGGLGGVGGNSMRPQSAWASGDGHRSARASTARPRTSMALDGNKSRRASLAFLGGNKDDDGQLLGSDMRQGSGLRDVLVQQSQKSFSQQLKKVAVEMVTEKRDADHLALIMNNAVALSLNSKSSECVQAILDSAAANKVGRG